MWWKRLVRRNFHDNITLILVREFEAVPKFGYFFDVERRFPEFSREREGERGRRKEKEESIENNSKKLIGNKVMFNTGGGGGNSVILLSPGVN